MNADRARDIFMELVANVPPEGWEARLAELAGGDAELRRRAEQLLAAHRHADSFLEGPAGWLGATVAERAVERPGTVVGPYKLLEQIGEGAFGVVFLAEQQQPLRRKVALKVLKPGMDSAQVIARFDVERQALALMDHPNIAKVLDGGETPAGRPYLVMDLVKGVRITEYCDQNQLTAPERLKLFVTVCQAVQHAHQKGIIHRDLKPSNVLVSRHDATPVVKVIDFGIAKALGQQLTDRTLFTGFTQLIGTPLYMSPEQAGMSDLDVDTRSDIYSLGVLLYELLTGTTPFDRERLKQAGYDELRRIIREEEPPKPSTRINTLDQAATTVAANRKSDPRRLSQLFRGELDWVVMKCLEKDRNRRYETASGLARDVERYLHDEPVQACPPSAWYRLRKFARRYKGSVLAAGLVVLALVGGVIGTSIGLVHADKARQREAQQRRIAEDREAETRAVLEFVEGKIFAAARPEGQEGGLGHDVKLRKALEEALPFVDKSFPNQPLVEARLRQTLGTSFAYLGEWKTAEEQFTKARDLYELHRGADHPDTLKSMNDLARSYFRLRKYDEALELRQHIVELRSRSLGPDHPDTLQSKNNLANSYARVRKFDKALELHTETLELRKDKLGNNHKDTLQSMHNVANCYAALGQTREALKRHKETLALRQKNLVPNHPDTLRSMNNVAFLYSALGQDAEALNYYDRTLTGRRDKLGLTHPDTLESMNALAWVLANCPNQSLRNPERAVDLAKQAVKLAPKNGRFLNTLGAAHYRASDWNGAVLALTKSTKFGKGGDATDWFFLAMAHWRLGDKDQGRKWYARAVQSMKDKKKQQDEELRRFRAEAAELLESEKK
jgi:serine/threonine protein kinase/tetratricopeptide (TPR) repeat protein